MREDDRASTPGEYVRRLRVRAGITQEELAIRVDVSAPFISQVEGGERLPALRTRNRMIWALGMTPEQTARFEELIESGREAVRESRAGGEP